MTETIKNYLKNTYAINLTSDIINEIITIASNGKYIEAQEHFMFIDLVRVLRCRQRQYFLDRTKDLLHECLTKEHEIDQIIKNKDIGSDRLFDGTIIFIPGSSSKPTRQFSFEYPDPIENI